VALLNEILTKARQRALGLDLRALADAARASTPNDIATDAQKTDRKNYLQSTLGSVDGQLAFERIISGNELQPINYLEIGTDRARAVGRIAIRDASGTQSGWASGFLIGPRLLLTNHHVFGQKTDALNSEVQFSAELAVDGRTKTPSVFRCMPDELFFANEALDFAVVAINQTPLSGTEPLSSFGHLSLVGRTGKVVDGEWLTIVQHPNGELKQLCIRENQLIKRTEDVLWYSTDTLGGSSGSPVFNNAWEVVALHHSGVPETRNGRIQTIDGRDFDANDDPDGASIKWIANEGIRVSRIVASLRQSVGNDPLIKLAFGESSPVALVRGSSTTPANTHIHQVGVKRNMSSSSRTIHLTINLDEAGGANVSHSEASAAVPASNVFESARRTDAERWQHESFIESHAISDLSNREGYDPKFLGGKVVVHLPELSDSLKNEAAFLLQPKGANKFELRYDGYTVVMNKNRRWAMYSAANVRASQRFELSGRKDRWLVDPRISLHHQVGEYYYKANKFDRGHLTRREDMEYGAEASIATARADETCYFTNATPQHSKFNQNKALWQGIERYLLEESIQAGNYNSQIVTGPVLSEDDPVYDRDKDVQYPVQFWKVISTLRADKSLFATAYLLDQSEVIDQFGIESTEVPFGAYKSFQVPIAEIERLTGLAFTATVDGKKSSLSVFDPLAKPRRQRRKPRGRFESSQTSATPDQYVALDSVWDIIKA
jgi:endonuclease G, mitochondrial